MEIESLIGTASTGELDNLRIWNSTKRKISSLVQKHLSELQETFGASKTMKCNISKVKLRSIQGQKTGKIKKLRALKKSRKKAFTFQVTPLQVPAGLQPYTALPPITCFHHDVDLQKLAGLLSCVLARESSCHLQKTSYCCSHSSSPPTQAAQSLHYSGVIKKKKSKEVQTDLSCLSIDINHPNFFVAERGVDASSLKTDALDCVGNLKVALKELTSFSESLMPFVAAFGSFQRNMGFETHISSIPPSDVHKESSDVMISALEATPNSAEGAEHNIAHMDMLPISSCTNDVIKISADVSTEELINIVEGHNSDLETLTHDDKKKDSDASITQEDADPQLKLNAALVAESKDADFVTGSDSSNEQAMYNVMFPNPVIENVPVLSNTSSDIPATALNEDNLKLPRKRKSSRTEVESNKTKCIEKNIGFKPEKTDNETLFEDIGSQELEGVFNLLKEQELLDQTKCGEPVSSSSDQRLLFKKVDKSQSLPPGLQNCRILPKVGKKHSKLLDALDAQFSGSRSQEEIHSNNLQLTLEQNSEKIVTEDQKTGIPLPDGANEREEEKDLFEGLDGQKEAALKIRLDFHVKPAKECKINQESNDDEESRKRQRHSKLKDNSEEKSKSESKVQDNEKMPPPSVHVLVNNCARAKEDLMALDAARAHDLAVFVVLNPWRGLVGKRTSKRFVPPLYNKKDVVAALWKLRSYAPQEQVASQILDVGWTNVNIKVFETMVQMFVEALSRSAPFVIEAAVCEEDADVSNCSSECSELEMQKRRTPIRAVASKPIKKRETICGIKGLIVEVASEEELHLKKWNLLKSNKNQIQFGIYGPVAYLKHKKHNNAEAFMSADCCVSVKAIKNIQKGEKITVGFKAIAESLSCNS